MDISVNHRFIILSYFELLLQEIAESVNEHVSWKTQYEDSFAMKSIKIHILGV